jgi:hypothetical protein
MAMTEFYFNDLEIRKLVEFINSLGGKIIPDILYDQAEYRILKDYEEFNIILNDQTVHFFVIDNSFMKEDLKVTRNRYLEDNKYYINQRKGGPYIDLFFFRGFSDDAIIKYKRSEISTYSKFIHFEGHEEFKATDELIEYYKYILAYIKKNSKRVKINNRYFNIGLEVLDEIKSIGDYIKKG